jgi:uncharacterized protein YndB with AHSA1/START domain
LEKEKTMASHVTPSISNDAVRSRTGKSWNQWFSIIDRAGGKKKSHKEIVAVLKKYRLGGWWEQMVTVTYEQARGLRKRHERPSGFTIGVSRVIAVGVSVAYDAWRVQDTRRRWLRGGRFTIRKATRGHSLRITWVDRATSVNVDFHRKGKNKSQVTVQHQKLPTARAAQRMKLYWTSALNSLKTFLEH